MKINNSLSWILLGLIIFIPISAAEQMSVAAKTNQAISLQISPICDVCDQELMTVAWDMGRCFSFTKQFEVVTKSLTKLPTKAELKALKKENHVLLLVTLQKVKKGFEWRLYDTMSSKLLGGHDYAKEGNLPRVWAYNIADEIWPMLTSQEGFFSTRIAFCKKPSTKQVKHIFIADFDGSHQEAIIDTPTINIAPRWNHDRKQPLLFYSDYTPTNVRLRVARLDKKSRVASNFDGLNMIPAFSRDGSKMVYCLSRGDGSCQIYYNDKDTFKNITHNNGNNISPSLSDDGTMVFFCSDFQTPSPQVYAHNLKTGKQERLTDGGYCTSPRYCPKSDKLAYAKMVDGVMQLFLYDIPTKSHEQLTFDRSTKQEGCWSPCGNWLIYAINERGKPGRIAILNRHSKQQQFLTDLGTDCSYPDWSPRYNQFPVLTA